MTQQDLPPGWVRVSVDELSELVEYGTSEKTNEGPDGVPVLRMGNIVEGVIIPEPLKYLPGDHFEFPRLLLRSGDILFNRTNSPELVGKSAVYHGAPENCSFASYLIRLRLTSACVPDYLSYFINSPFGRLWVNDVVSQQVGQANVNGSKLRALRFPLPPIIEQARIVAAIEQHLSDIDAGVAALERALANLKRYRASVLKAACEGKLVPTEAELARKGNRPYEHASALLGRILREHNSDAIASSLFTSLSLPPGWAATTLGSLLREPLRNGHSAPAASQNQTDGVRTFTLTAVTLGAFTEGNTKVTTADRSRVSDLWVQPDDIFVQRSNTPELVGTSRRYDGPAGFAIFPDLLIRVRVIGALCLPRYVELFLRSPRTRSYFRSRAQGIAGSMPKIDQGTLASCPISLPPLAEQHRIVAEVDRLLSTADETEQALRAQLARAARLRQAVLKKAFEGKLVPQDPNDEPATLLLERLRAEKAASPKPTSRRKRSST